MESGRAEFSRILKYIVLVYEYLCPMIFINFWIVCGYSVVTNNFKQITDIVKKKYT